MSETTPGPPDDAPQDTPPHGVPPVTRALLAAPRGDGAEHDDGDDDDRQHVEHRVGADGRASAGADETADGETADGETADRETAEDDRAERADRNGRHDRTGRHARLTRRGRIVATLLAVLLVVGGFVAWYEVEANPFGPPGKTVLVDVHAGESLGTIESALVKAQVIGTSFAFHLWSVVHGAPTVRPGTFQLHENLSFSAAKVALDAGPNVAELTVLPGMTVSEVASALSSLPGKLAHAFSEAGAAGGVGSPFQASPGASLEGLIGSGTYRVLPGETGHELLAQMVARFDREAASAGLKTSTTVAGLDAYQLVTLASIAQKEGYFTRYMGDVARVIYNRLAAGINLDMTSTVLYSFGKDGGPVTSHEEETTTPYNTYLHAGLTPTPICTVSVQALRAALDPPAGGWLYFDLVTAKKGIMKFAATYTGELALEQEAAANAATQSTSASSTSSSPGSGT